MRKIWYSLLFVNLTLVSCVDIQKSQIEKQAIEAFRKSYDKDNNIKVDNIKTVFYTQNMCILHAEDNDVNAPNNVEYLFITQDGKSYEAFQDLSEDSVFVSEPTLKKISKGTMYENMDFAEAIFFRAAHYINSYGKEVGSDNRDFWLRIPMKTGFWELCDNIDEFGDKTSGKYLRLIGKGTYNDNYTKDGSLLALLFINKQLKISLRLVEKEKGIVEGFGGQVKFKDGDGEIHEIPFLGLSSKEYSVFDVEGKKQKEFKEMIEKEGILSGIATQGGGLFEPNKTHFKFTFNLNGLKKALSYLVPNLAKDTMQSDETDAEDDYYEEEIDSENEIEPVQITREDESDSIPDQIY